MKFNLYAPVNGEIKDIKDLSDGIFSKQMLGSGFFIKPKSETLYSPLEDCQVVNIFETKHALILKKQNISILMHIGIDTVNLKGEGFKILVKEKQNITTNLKIALVDFQKISKDYDDAVCITFINENENKNTNFKLIRSGFVNAGEKVGEINFELKEKNNILEFKNRYEHLAEVIYKAIGGEKNYLNFWNCMTRLRFVVKDKTKVDETLLKNLKNTQGFIWSGNELQIVIGADVVKAKDAYDFYVEHKDRKTIGKNKIGFYNRAKKNVSGVMTLMIPYFIAAGMLYAVWTLLQTLNVVENVSLDYTNLGEIKLITNYSVLTGVFYIICTTGLAFMGFAFGYCTVKFMGGNTVIGGLICLTLLAIPLYGGLKWELFKIGEVSFDVKGYTNLIIPQICAAVFYVLFDKWVKTWMPNVIDLVFRHLLAVFITLTLFFFVMGPIMNLFELGLFYLIKFIDNIPFGISVGIFSFIAPITTVLGIGWIVSTPMAVNIAKGTPNAMYCAWYLGEMAMAGATFAVAFKTRNSNTKKIGYSTGVTGIFGISEPCLYSILLPRYRPFFIAIISAGISGWIVGILGLKVYTLGGSGIFFVVKFMAGGLMPILLSLLGMLISLTLSFLLTFFFWNEKINQVKEVTKLNNSVYLATLKFGQSIGIDIDIEKYKQKFALTRTKFNKNYFEIQKKVEISLYERLKTEVKLISIRDKMEKREAKLVTKAKKTQSKNNLTKFEKYKQLIEKNIYENIEYELNAKLLKLNEISQKNVNTLNKINFEIECEIKTNLNSIANEFEFKKIKDFINSYWNIIYNIEIFYDYKIAKEIIISKELFKNKRVSPNS